MELRNTHRASTITVIFSGKNHQWALKLMGECQMQTKHTYSQGDFHKMPINEKGKAVELHAGGERTTASDRTSASPGSPGRERGHAHITMSAERFP